MLNLLRKSGLIITLLSASILIFMCQNQSEAKLDLSQPDSTAKVFVKAFVNNDTTLFNRLLINKNEFEDFVAPFRGRPGAERGILEFMLVWQSCGEQFRESRERAAPWLEEISKEKTKYSIVNPDIDPETGFIEFDFQVAFEAKGQFGVRLYLIETANKLPIAENSSPSAIKSIKNSEWKIFGVRVGG